jgi:5-methylcytosine-specific restriction endonuclease McrA
MLCAVLRADKKAEIVALPWTLPRLFFGRYALQSGKRIFDVRWKKPWVEEARARQQGEPVPLFTLKERSYWWFHDCVYWDDDELSSDDVKALVLQRERTHHRKLQTAHSLMRAEEDGRPTRTPVPVEIRRAVFERDSGKCVECDSNFDLQYDHVLPVALGGATTVENLQLLCADCNQRKSDSL